MGGGPDKEHLVIALWDPEPTHITDEIKRRWPHIEITYVQLASPISFKDVGDQVPPGMLFLLLSAPSNLRATHMNDLRTVRLIHVQRYFARPPC